MELTPQLICRLYRACGGVAAPLMVQRLLGRNGVAVLATMTACAEYFDTAPTSPHAIAFERKMRRARLAASLVAHLPFVRALAVCNSLGLHTVHENSDIDFFIITARGRAWTARFFVTAALALARLRTGEARRDPVCASFFVDETVSDLSHLMIERDIYFEVWQRALIPLFGASVFFKNVALTAPHAHTGSKKISLAQKVFEFFARAFPESAARHIQWRLMPAEVRASAGRGGTNVVCASGIIKLHLNDRRVALRDAVYSV